MFRAITLVAVLMLNCGAGLAQTPPTATEAFNLRIKCKQMADEKAEFDANASNDSGRWR